MSYKGKRRIVQTQHAVVVNQASGVSYLCTQTFTTHTGRVRVSYTGALWSGGGALWVDVAVARDSVAQYSPHLVEASNTLENQVFSVAYVDAPGPGTYTWSLYCDANINWDLGGPTAGGAGGVISIIEELP